MSIKASLKKLRTDYIDILYVHSWDYTTTVEEMMNSLHNLVVQGKVLYLGVSDTPAWVVSEANTYARMAGKTPFIVYQGAWNIMQRDVERDILPMCIKHGKPVCFAKYCTCSTVMSRDGLRAVERSCHGKDPFRRRRAKTP